MRKNLAEKGKCGQDQKGSEKSSGERLKKPTYKRKKTAKAFGKMACSSLMKCFW